MLATKLNLDYSTRSQLVIAVLILSNVKVFEPVIYVQ